ncbi:hypothetical protein [Microbacterium sp. NPDC055683]
MTTDMNTPDIPDISDRDRAGRRPLGFWLTAADAVLAREIDDALASEHVDRRDWRLLNALAGTVDAPGLHDRLARKPHRVARLADRGWTALEDGEWTLTEDGRAALDRMTTAVAAVRERVAAAVPADDLDTTIASLEAIARALGWEEGAPLPRRAKRAGRGDRAGRAEPRGRRRGGQPDAHGAWPGRGHGFGPEHGIGPGHGHGFGHGHRFEPAHGRGFGHGFRPDGHGPGHGFGPDDRHGFDPHRGHGHDRGGRRRHGFDPHQNHDRCFGPDLRHGAGMGQGDHRRHGFGRPHRRDDAA